MKQRYGLNEYEIEQFVTELRCHHCGSRCYQGGVKLYGLFDAYYKDDKLIIRDICINDYVKYRRFRRIEEMGRDKK